MIANDRTSDNGEMRLKRNTGEEAPMLARQLASVSVTEGN